MYDCKWTQDFLERSRADYHTDDVPGFKIIENALLLPQKEASGHSWGIGGAVSPDGTVAEASCVGQVFGGAYQVREEDILYNGEILYFIPIIPRHWGHFLVDVVSRLWYVAEHPEDTRKITYCGWKLNDDGVSGNFLAFLEGIGIQRERLVYVKKPLHVKKVIIPDRTFEYSGRFHEKYFSSSRKND